jgi:hypothetical protein
MATWYRVATEDDVWVASCATREAAEEIVREESWKRGPLVIERVEVRDGSYRVVTETWVTVAVTEDYDTAKSYAERHAYDYDGGLYVMLPDGRVDTGIAIVYLDGREEPYSGDRPPAELLGE